MSERERDVRRARSRISDEQLIAFLRAIRDDEAVFAAQLINEQLDKGESLDAIFCTGDEFGFLLDVKRRSGSNFQIFFGCHAAPLAGDAATWKVQFDGRGQVESVEGSDYMIS